MANPYLEVQKELLLNRDNQALWAVVFLLAKLGAAVSLNTSGNPVTDMMADLRSRAGGNTILLDQIETELEFVRQRFQSRGLGQ